tara:strand:- start:346 stop:612 length:267 start_codon:yes stop_codon:yes gene_type:complete
MDKTLLQEAGMGTVQHTYQKHWGRNPVNKRVMAQIGESLSTFDEGLTIMLDRIESLELELEEVKQKLKAKKQPAQRAPGKARKVETKH